ncbi:MAG: alkaline phosphatase family protein [Victivallales bacterium]|nr:alkaline phosphatase family protein [Victivallales bacterium]
MKLIVVEAAALGYGFWETRRKADFWSKLKTACLDTVFPAVTCTVQASLRTALPPSGHGMIANGLFDRELRKVFFWEQSSRLYDGPRIWEDFRKSGHTVGQICWQQSLGNDSDMILSPAPIHKHHGGMIQDFYSRPADVYGSISAELGKKLNLRDYWGPFASPSSGEWIAEASARLLSSDRAPELLLIYLPHLDYDMQRHGPHSNAAVKAFERLEKSLELLFAAGKLAGYETVVFGDYAISPAESAIYPNMILRDAGLLSVRVVKGALYADLFSSRAFAMADHQVAHVFVPDKNDTSAAKSALQNVQGIRKILSREEFGHQRAGELVLEAAPGCWFAYPWWKANKEAPEYASHVDIHNKPGFDPCELFLALWPPMSVSSDSSKVKGTHGITDCKIPWASSVDMDCGKTILDAAESLKGILSDIG